MPKWSKKGVSDIILLYVGKAFFIEVKAKGSMSDDQKLFKIFVERAGCEYILARGVEDVKKAGF